MPYRKTKWSLVRSRTKPLPQPCEAELLKIRRSLNMQRDEPFMRCRGKMSIKVRAFEKKGDFSHSGSQTNHTCNLCRCKRIAGQGTSHYGVGYCYYHDIDSARRMAKAQMIAIRQGYPLDPIKYKSDTDYINDVRRQSEESGNVLSVRDDLALMRAHLQEFEKFWRTTDPTKKLTMKTARGAADMTDDVKITCLTKFALAISRFTRDQYVITESDYVAVDEIKTWFWAIIQALERNCRKMLANELQPKDFQAAMMADLREIPQPKAGRKRKQ